MSIKTGTVAGTGAAINVEVGFVPAMVILINETDPGLCIWTQDMADAEMLKATDAVAITFPTTNGISVFAGVEGTTGKGFTIGADSDLNGASDVIHYVAINDE